MRYLENLPAVKCWPKPANWIRKSDKNSYRTTVSVGVDLGKYVYVNVSVCVFESVCGSAIIKLYYIYFCIGRESEVNR